MIVFFFHHFLRTQFFFHNFQTHSFLLITFKLIIIFFIVFLFIILSDIFQFNYYYAQKLKIKFCINWNDYWLQKLERFNSFLSFVRDNYVGTEEKLPRFRVAWQSVFSRVSNGIEKASCRPEAWHRVFSFDIRKKPNLILLINLFLLEQSLVAMTVEQLKSGDEFKTRIELNSINKSCSRL